MSFPPALPHGSIEMIAPDVFVVPGMMEAEFFGDTWRFGRNMVILRHTVDDAHHLFLFNSIRLDDEGLAQLESLGEVKGVVRLGSMHGRDDAFYVDRYRATMWAPPGMEPKGEARADRVLDGTGEGPLGGPQDIFLFETTTFPECIFFHTLSDGRTLAISSDALQNWSRPDPYTDPATATRMREMGFYTPANVGVAWLQGAQPRPEDFRRLLQRHFHMALCGHGEPLLEDASERYRPTFERLAG